jgi:hypothetical protein
MKVYITKIYIEYKTYFNHFSVMFKSGIYTFILIAFLASSSNAQPGGENKLSSSFKIVRLKYAGGGDWYNDPSAEVNMMDFLKKNTTIDVDEPKFYYVDISSDEIFNYPFIFITGHGNISFTDSEIKRLRTYLERGGFLYADDDYGMNDAFRREMKKVFPEQEMKELPFDHNIYSSHFSFPNGLPKTHEHDGKPPQGFGYFIDGRLCVFYTYETNISDGWADPREHDDPPEKREEALKMGTNIIVYALSN